MYIKRFLHLALDGMPKHKKYTKDVFANDRIWLEKVSLQAVPEQQTQGRILRGGWWKMRLRPHAHTLRPHTTPLATLLRRARGRRSLHAKKARSESQPQQ